MINIFKKFTPSFQNIVRKYATDCWYDRQSESDFLNRVQNFRKRFEKELITFYRGKGIKIDLKEIQDLSFQWQVEQMQLAHKIKTDIQGKEKKELKVKKEELHKELVDKFEVAKKAKRKEFVPVLSPLSAGKMDKDFLKKSNQLGDEAAFDFISKINNKIILDTSDKGVFKWITQGDNKVRPTHRKLDKKVFAWNNLPKIDGEEVEPGSQWGCRCYGEITTGKPLKNYEIKS